MQLQDEVKLEAGELSLGNKHPTMQISKLLAQRKQLLSLHDSVRAKTNRVASPVTSINTKGVSSSDVARKSTPVSCGEDVSLDNIDLTSLSSTESIKTIGNGEGPRANAALPVLSFSAYDASLPLTVDVRANGKRSLKQLNKPWIKSQENEIPQNLAPPMVADEPLIKTCDNKDEGDHPALLVFNERVTATPRKPFIKKKKGCPTSPMAAVDEEVNAINQNETRDHPATENETSVNWSKLPNRKEAQHPSSLIVKDEAETTSPIQFPDKEKKAAHHNCPIMSPVKDASKLIASKKPTKKKSAKKNLARDLPKMVHIENSLHPVTCHKDDIVDTNREGALSPSVFFKRYGFDDWMDDVWDEVIDDVRDAVEVKAKKFT